MLAAHLLADFVLQPDWMVARKARYGVFGLHVLIVTGLSAVFLGSFPWIILGAIFGSHAALDFVKTRLGGDGPRAFVGDQIGHVAVIGLLAALFPLAADGGCWEAWLDPEVLGWCRVGVAVGCGVILTGPVGGILIGKLTEPLRREVAEAEAARGASAVDGLAGGGRMIGWLERLLAVLFYLIGQPTGIGFLLAAKSILRFGEIKESSQRKMAEYIIIGTFLSFGWALVVAVPLRAAIERWDPRPVVVAAPVRVVVEDPRGVRP